MTASHVLFVCTQCATVRVNNQPQGKSGGQELLEEMRRLAAATDLPDHVAIQPVQCMFACEKSCLAAFTAAGKYTYLFAHLQPATAALALVECARHYVANPDGVLPYGVRPEPLKTAVLARIPPQLGSLLTALPGALPSERAQPVATPETSSGQNGGLKEAYATP